MWYNGWFKMFIFFYFERAALQVLLFTVYFSTSICFTCDCCFCLLFNLFYWPMYVFKRFYQLHHIVLLRGWFKQMLEVFFLLRKLLFTILITCQTLYLHLNLYLYYIIFILTHYIALFNAFLNIYTLRFRSTFTLSWS